MIEREVRTLIHLEEVSYDGHKVGFILATFHHNGLLFLNQIRVNEKFRSLGYGRNLMKNLLSLGIRLGANRLEGNFSPDKGSESKARTFYHRMGIQISKGMIYKSL